MKLELVIVCWYWSIAILGVSILILFTLYKYRKFSEKESYFGIAHLFFACVFLSAFVMFIGQYRNISTMDSIARSVVRALKIFVLGDGGDCNAEIYQNKNRDYTLYNVYLSILYIIAPLSTFSVLIAYLYKFKSIAVYYFLFWRKTYIFSELNEEALTLAEDIRKTEIKEVLIIFTGLKYNTNTQLISRAKKKGMLCLQKEITYINFLFQGRYKKSIYVLCGKKGNTNMEYARDLIEKYRDKKYDVEIFVFSRSKAIGQTLDSIDKGEIKVRRVDETRSIVYQTLDERPLFLGMTASETGEGRPKMKVLIVGMGHTGMEFLKAALWCGQIDGCELEIILVDKKEEKTVRKMVEGKCPEIIQNENLYHLCFKSIDSRSSEFTAFLKNNSDITYVFICQGKDRLNIDAGMKVRETMEQFRYGKLRRQILGANKKLNAKPIINIVVRRQKLNQTVNDLIIGTSVHDRGNDNLLHEDDGSKKKDYMFYNLYAIGGIEQIYSYANIFNPEMERYARNVHKVYSDCGTSASEEDRERWKQKKYDFDDLEYNRFSSQASAFHIKYNLYAYCKRMGEDHCDWSKYLWEKNLSHMDKELIQDYCAYMYTAKKEDYEWLSIMEHDRWCAYIRTEGFTKAEIEDVQKYYDDTGDTKHILAKKHPCLVQWNELNYISMMISEIKNETVDYKAKDEAILRKIKQILNEEDTG